jgi:hypothetical protein
MGQDIDNARQEAMGGLFGLLERFLRVRINGDILKIDWPRGLILLGVGFLIYKNCVISSQLVATQADLKDFIHFQSGINATNSITFYAIRSNILIDEQKFSDFKENQESMDNLFKNRLNIKQ